jgi:N6-adenosine-specific RNA methylase IME4
LTTTPSSASVTVVKTTKYSSKIDLLTKQEYDLLKQSIAEKGLYETIKINKLGDVLDGHHRLQICQELGIEPRFEVKEFPDELSEEIYVIDTNVARRQLSAFRKAELLLLKKKPVLEKQARENMAAAAASKGKGVKHFTPLERVNEELAKQADMSHTQMHKVETILEKAPEDLKQKVRSEQTSINMAYQQVIRADDRNKPKPAPPEGQYDILYVDPPWSYDFSAVRGNPNDHYATMTDEEIMRMIVPAADNAVLFLWVPYPKNREAFDLVDAWGFKYKSKIIWVKDKIGTGHYVRAKHEELFICVKGDGLGIPAEADRPPSIIEAERTEHSKKPEIFYSILERMYPNRTRIELFARGKAREGWKTWGLETAEEEDIGYKMQRAATLSRAGAITTPTPKLFCCPCRACSCREYPCNCGCANKCCSNNNKKKKMIRND